MHHQYIIVVTSQLTFKISILSNGHEMQSNSAVNIDVKLPDQLKQSLTFDFGLVVTLETWSGSD